MDEALESLSSQGMGDDLEVIIQDGDVEPDRGQSDALNKGFAKARGEWLFWLNADDVLLPGALEKVKCAIQEGGDRIDWIAGNVIYINQDGRCEWCAWDRGWKISYAGLPVQVYGPSSFFRRRLFAQSKKFDLSLVYAMDVDLWCNFRKLGHWYRKVPSFLWGFRLHAGSKTSAAQKGRWAPAHIAERLEINRCYGLSNLFFAHRFAQFTRIINGSYLKSYLGTVRHKGEDYCSLSRN